MRTSALTALALAALAACPARADGPYPSRGLITGLTFDWASFRQLAKGSDNWATTWAADGSVYTSYGDGDGFGDKRQSLGFARLTGSSAGTVRGANLPSGPLRSGKTYGLLAIGDTLYAFVSPGSNGDNYREARLYRAPLGTGDWVRARWAFDKGSPYRIVLPTFLQAGRDYADGGRWV